MRRRTSRRERQGMNQLDMQGRAAIVTGGAAGIGLAIARRLVASGARVSLWDRDAAALASAAQTLGGGDACDVLGKRKQHVPAGVAAA